MNGRFFFLIALVGALLVAVAATAAQANVGGPTVPDPGGGGGAYFKQCTPDGGDHVATVELNASNSVVWGYWVNYQRHGGFELGNHNNELQWTEAGSYWGSDDWAPPGWWVYRDAPDYWYGGDRQTKFYRILAAFDHNNAPDPQCVINWFF